MRRNFFISSLKLILLGVALGMLARYMFGGAESTSDHGRNFNSPISSEVDDSKPEYEIPDFPLPPDWDSNVP